MVEVVLKDVNKRFGSVHAVKDLSFSVKDKEFFALLGPSGCGKTTTLRMIAGLETVDSGEIYVGDELINDVPPKDRGISMVFQDYALYPHMTAFKNIEFPLRIKGIALEERRKRVVEVANFLEIRQLLSRKPRAMSGGERQRVALGRAIVRRPHLFLMDEPLANLDAKIRVRMRSELKTLQKRLGITTIYVTHDQEEAMTMADRIAIMRDGYLQQCDRPMNVYNQSANLFVASFVGSPPINLFQCHTEKENNEIFAFLNGVKIRLPNSQVEGKHIIAGFRPEDVIIRKKKIPNSLRGEILVTEPIGVDTIVTLTIDDNVVKARAEASFQADFGDQVWVTFNEEKVHLFDESTKQKL